LISRNTTRLQPYNLQAMLTGETRKDYSKSRKSK